MPVVRELLILNFSYSEKLGDSLEERHMLIAKMLFDKDKNVIEILKNHIEEARILSIEEKKIEKYE